MKSSAKSTLSILAAAALGAAAWMGCTIESGTGSSIVDDVDGGKNNPNPDTGNGSDAGKDETDSGSVVGATCESKQESVFISETCQVCLEKSCCTQLQGCYDLPADADAGTTDCNAYDTCINFCSDKPDDELDECYSLCDDTAAEGVQAAYEGIVTCAKSSCAAECGAE